MFIRFEIDPFLSQCVAIIVAKRYDHLPHTMKYWTMGDGISILYLYCLMYFSSNTFLSFEALSIWWYIIDVTFQTFFLYTNDAWFYQYLFSLKEFMRYFAPSCQLISRLLLQSMFVFITVYTVYILKIACWRRNYYENMRMLRQIPLHANKMNFYEG